MKIIVAFKVKVAIKAIPEKLTLQEISSNYTIHQNQITTWKKKFLDKSEMISQWESLRNQMNLMKKDLYFNKVFGYTVDDKRIDTLII
jgi:hypothetical protein